MSVPSSAETSVAVLGINDFLHWVHAGASKRIACPAVFTALSEPYGDE
jgi:hypothetical protein